MWTFSGNANELGNTGGDPGKSFLFSLTAYHPEIGLSGARVTWSVELSTSVGSGASSTVLENPRECTLSRLVVLITAAGLLGEQPLVDRTM
jgi:hypothetical protein